MVTQNYFAIPATVLEKFRSRGFPEGVTLTTDHCTGQREGGGFSCINKRIISHPVTSPFPLHVSLFPDEDLEARDSHNLRDYTFVYEGSFRNTKDLQKP